MEVCLAPGGVPLSPELPDSGSLGLHIRSRIPVGVGFGSSAALCVASAQAVCRYLVKKTTPEMLLDYAHTLEKQFHRTPSGIDTAISLHAAPSRLRRNEKGFFDCDRLPLCPLHLVVGALPRTSTTAELIALVRASPERNARIGILGEIAESACTAWGDSAVLGELANRAQRALQALGLSTPPIDGLLREGSHPGAPGGKLSGAGGRGAGPTAQDLPHNTRHHLDRRSAPF